MNAYMHLHLVASTMSENTGLELQIIQGEIIHLTCLSMLQVTCAIEKVRELRFN